MESGSQPGLKRCRLFLLTWRCRCPPWSRAWCWGWWWWWGGRAPGPRPGRRPPGPGTAGAGRCARRPCRPATATPSGPWPRLPTRANILHSQFQKNIVSLVYKIQPCWDFWLFNSICSTFCSTIDRRQTYETLTKTKQKSNLFLFLGNHLASIRLFYGSDFWKVTLPVPTSDKLRLR